MTVATIYTKSACKNCSKAKAWLTSKGIEYKEIDLDDKPTLAEFVKQFPDVKSVPAVFIDDELNWDWKNR